MDNRLDVLQDLENSNLSNSDYNKDFYEAEKSSSEISSKKIIPILMEMFNPKSVVDVGCGTGAFLSEFRKNGLSNTLGIDGPWLDRTLLQIDNNDLLIQNLSEEIKIDKKFDLVISLEVAEHIEQKFAESFVRSLTRLGSVVLFSAAIPFQGGTHHVNEQWPDYWAKLFSNLGYVPVDCIRRKLWNEDIDLIYAQNSIIYIDRKVLHQYQSILDQDPFWGSMPLRLVHPRLYEIRERNKTLGHGGVNRLQKYGVFLMNLITKIDSGF